MVKNVGVSIHTCRKSRDSIPEVTRHVSYVRVRRSRQRSLLRASAAKQVEYTLVTCVVYNNYIKWYEMHIKYTLIFKYI